MGPPPCYTIYNAVPAVRTRRDKLSRFRATDNVDREQTLFVFAIESSSYDQESPREVDRGEDD